MSPDSVCNSTDLTVLLGIVSSAENSFARAAVRNSWASITLKNTNPEIRHIFLIGRSMNNSVNNMVKEENEIFNDILYGDFLDTYRNVTFKTVMLIQWFTQQCPHARFMVKVDDDVFLNTTGLLKVVTGKPSLEYKHWICLWGCIKNSYCVRDPTNKWFIPFRDYLYRTYPVYCLGAAYLISKDLVTSITPLTTSVPYIPIEDAYVGICVDKLNDNEITITDVLDSSNTSYQETFAIHGLGMDTFVDTWHFFNKGGNWT